MNTSRLFKSLIQLLCRLIAMGVLTKVAAAKEPGDRLAGNGGAMAGQRFRVIISTDIGGTDPDDFHPARGDRPGKTRTWWHPLLARMMDHLLSGGYSVQEEVPIGKLPLRVDILLIRREDGQLLETGRRELSVLLPLHVSCGTAGTGHSWRTCCNRSSNSAGWARTLRCNTPTRSTWSRWRKTC